MFIECRTKNNSYRRGVTLLELMVVIGIVGIMMAVSLVSLKSTRTGTRLNEARSDVAATIKLAQSYALQGKMQKGQPVCGYGFRFKNKTDYEVYYYPVPGGGCGDPPAFSAAAVKIAESRSLGSGIEVYNQNDQNNPNATIVYFKLPNGDPYDQFGTAYAGSTLEFKIDSSKKSITVNSRGYVEE